MSPQKSFFFSFVIAGSGGILRNNCSCEIEYFVLYSTLPIFLGGRIWYTPGRGGEEIYCVFQRPLVRGGG